MIRFLLLIATANAAFAVEPALYELSGRMVPRMGGYISLFGVESPFAARTLADVSGNFKFKRLQPGAYTLAIYSRRRGEFRRTIEIGPATADRKRRVSLKLVLQESDFNFAAVMRGNLVSARQLAVPESAMRDFREAQNDLSKGKVDSAIARLERAVERAPQFAGAWNTLGVIAYQTRKYDRAEECFREALEQEPEMYEALLNLGGVLLTVHKLDEAMDYNLKAVLAHPNDALANSQLGMTYFSLGQEDLALKYLERARAIDPANFSHPQLVLFQIHIRRGQKESAAYDLQDFLGQHPDWPEAPQLRQAIANLRDPSH